jgi:hypothetical protein
MKHFVTLFILLLSISIYSQENNKWKVGILSSFDKHSSNRNLVTDGNINGYIIEYAYPFSSPR